MDRENNERVLESWLTLTKVINNEKITSSLPYNESLICRYLYQNADKNITATQLCQWLRMQKSQMNRTMNNMEAKGIITREKNHDDKRESFIKLNPEMLNVYHAQHEKILEIIDRMFDKIGEDKVDQIVHLFQTITEAAEETLEKK